MCWSPTAGTSLSAKTNHFRHRSFHCMCCRLSSPVSSSRRVCLGGRLHSKSWGHALELSEFVVTVIKFPLLGDTVLGDSCGSAVGAVCQNRTAASSVDGARRTCGRMACSSGPALPRESAGYLLQSSMSVSTHEGMCKDRRVLPELPSEREGEVSEMA